MENNENIFMYFTKENDNIASNFAKKDGTDVADVLLGISLAIESIIEITGKSKYKIFDIIDTMLDMNNEYKQKKKNKKEECCNGRTRIY